MVKKPSVKHEVCHIDGSKDNNRPENLRWGTGRKTSPTCTNTAQNKKGSKHANAKLTEVAVAEMRIRHKKGESPSKLMDEYGISRTAFYYAINRKTWHHVAAGKKDE
jgi:hypothetical protein